MVPFFLKELQAVLHAVVVGIQSKSSHKGNNAAAYRTVIPFTHPSYVLLSHMLLFQSKEFKIPIHSVSPIQMHIFDSSAHFLTCEMNIHMAKIIQSQCNFAYST